MRETGTTTTKKPLPHDVKAIRKEIRTVLNRLAQKMKRVGGTAPSQTTINCLSGHFPYYFGNEASSMTFFSWIEEMDAAGLPKMKEDAQKLRGYLVLLWNSDPPKDPVAGVSRKELRKWEDEQKRTRTFGIRIGFDLQHSEAYKSLKFWAALKVLNFFHERIRTERVKGRRGKDRWRLIDDGKFSFRYTDAILRGLTRGQYARALKELHSRGFFDFAHVGSGLAGDYSVFVLSNRWRQFGTKDFVEVEFPRGAKFGFQGLKE
jgi:hypothetical protein